MVRRDRNATPGCVVVMGVALIASTALALGTIIIAAMRSL